jgi:hypothetical protein
MDPEDIEHRFKYHKPDAEKAALHQIARARCRGVADDLNDLLPECREKSLVMTKLEEAMFWANAAIARDVPRG